MDGFLEESLICRCYRVPEGVIRKAVQAQQLQQVEEVTAVTNAGGGCSSCYDDIQKILCTIWGKPVPRDVPDGSGLSSAQKRALIVETIESEVQAMLDMNGLVMQLADVTGDRVLVRFSGESVGTTASSFLSVKRYLVKRMSDACGQKMNLIELNVLEHHARLVKR